VGFAWDLCAVIWTSEVSVGNVSCVPHESTEEAGSLRIVERVASMCELRENNNSLLAIWIKHRI
jgi:hypothetical protein